MAAHLPKTLYRLAFDEDELIKSCTKSLSEMQPVAKAMVSFSKATIKQSQSGLDVKAQSNGTTSAVIDVAEQPLPDILGVLQEKTGLTRRSLSTILKESGRLADFAKNPQQFISEAIGRINYCKRLSIVDGIKYYPLKGEVYAQSLFMDKELTGYARNLLKPRLSQFTNTFLKILKSKAVSLRNSKNRMKLSFM